MKADETNQLNLVVLGDAGDWGWMKVSKWYKIFPERILSIFIFLLSESENFTLKIFRDISRDFPHQNSQFTTLKLFVIVWIERHELFIRFIVYRRFSQISQHWMHWRGWRVEKTGNVYILSRKISGGILDKSKQSQRLCERT